MGAHYSARAFALMIAAIGLVWRRRKEVWFLPREEKRREFKNMTRGWAWI